MAKQPLRIGHRGAAGHAPENTLLSIETALSMGAEVIEIDVHRSRDGELIVMHDDRVDRTTNGTGYIRDLTLSQLRALDIPTLAEAIQAVKGRAELMIELKVRGLVPDVIRAAAGLPVFYASFLHSELLPVRELDAAARTIALLEAVPVSLTDFAIDAQATHAGIAFESLEPDFVRALQDAGLRVFTYTVNEPRDIAHARSLGVDGLISNFPDRLL